MYSVKTTDLALTETKKKKVEWRARARLSELDDLPKKVARFIGRKFVHACVRRAGHPSPMPSDGRSVEVARNESGATGTADDPGIANGSVHIVLCDECNHPIDGAVPPARPPKF